MFVGVRCSCNSNVEKSAGKIINGVRSSCVDCKKFRKKKILSRARCIRSLVVKNSERDVMRISYSSVV